MKQKHTKYTRINTNNSIYVQQNGPGVMKPNQENCKDRMEQLWFLFNKRIIFCAPCTSQQGQFSLRIDCWRTHGWVILEFSQKRSTVSQHWHGLPALLQRST